MIGVDPVPGRKRPHGDLVVLPSGGGSVAASTITTSTITTQKKMVRTVGSRQMKLCGNAVDPNAPEHMNIAIADLIRSQ